MGIHCLVIHSIVGYGIGIIYGVLFVIHAKRTFLCTTPSPQAAWHAIRFVGFIAGILLYLLLFQKIAFILFSVWFMLGFWTSLIVLARR